MRSMLSLVRLNVLALVAAALACEADDEPVWWEGEFVRYAKSSELTVCAGTPLLADSFVPFIAGELGIDLPPMIDYQWLTVPDYGSRSNCPAASSGCSSGTSTYALDPLLLHELVHSVTSASGMNRLAFFSEGLAVAYDPLSRFMDSRYVLGFPDGLEDPRPEMTLPSGRVSYSTAGGFVNFLLARHGPEKLVAISQRSRQGDDLDKIRSAFKSVYGTELDNEAELYLKSDELGCESGVFDVRPHDCTMPEVAWSGESWVYANIMDCEQEDVAGGALYSSWQSVTLHVPTDDRYVVRAFGDGDLAVRLGRCFGCAWQHKDVLLYAGYQPEIEVTLEAGHYFVRMEANPGDLPLVGVNITPIK